MPSSSWRKIGTRGTIRRPLSGRSWAFDVLGTWILLMALAFAHGVIQWNAADGLSTIYTVSGLSFQPKALHFSTNGQASAVDAASAALNSQRCHGFATTTSDRRCQASNSIDAAAAGDCNACYREDAAVITIAITVAAAVTGALDLNSITSDGFTLIVDDVVPADITVAWEAWGGADLTNAEVITIVEPALAGNQETNLVGAFQPNVLLFAHCGSDGAAPNNASGVGQLMLGWATGSAAANNVCVLGNTDDASATMDTDGYNFSGECIAGMAVAGAAACDLRAIVASLDADGFTINFLETANLGRRIMVLAIKGGQWAAGSYTIAAGTLNATATVSGLAFQPIAGLGFTRGSVQSTVDTTQAEDSISFGCWSSTTSRRCMGAWDETGIADAEINLAIEYDQMLVVPSGAGGVLSAFDLDALNSDGFRVIEDVAGGAASEFHGYLAFGSDAVGGGRIMSKLAWAGGLAGRGGIAGLGGGLAG